MRFGKWSGCLEKATSLWWMPILRATSTRSHTGGTPQGAVISPLLANIYLHALDCQIKQKGYRMVRYADDFVVLCRSREEAEAALAEVKAWVESNGLSLSADKTHVGDCRQKGQGFDFWVIISSWGSAGYAKRATRRCKIAFG